MLYMLEGRGKIVESQTQVTRAYIAKNYVSKIKGMKGAEGVQVSKDHLENPQAIPLPATATREMSEELSKTGLFNARLISSQPLNPANASKDRFEEEALKAIMSGAETYSRVEESGGIPTFRRASADKATGAACIGC